LAIVDLLAPPEVSLDEAQQQANHGLARRLLADLQPLLVIDWRKKYDKTAKVKVAIQSALDELPPEIYDEATYERLCAEVYQHVRESYEGEGRGKYARS
jgi:type I restriction enzyme R subunit